MSTEIVDNNRTETATVAAASVETWIGPADRPIFASIHRPADGTARGAVVICGPLGREHVTTYRGVRQLAERVADAGLLAVRFDYPGLGDSAGPQDDPAALSGWLDGIRSAVDYARSTGAGEVTLVGLRAGALLASAALTHLGPLRSVVLWDPVAAGRRYVREQTALYRMTVGEDDPVDPRVSITGAVWHPDAVTGLSALSIDPSWVRKAVEPIDPGQPPRVLCAVRIGDAGGRWVRELTDEVPTDTIELDRQEAFVNPPSFIGSVPTASIDTLATWIVDRHRDLPAAAVRLDVATTRRVGVTPGGQDILETISRRGPHDLVTITTRVDGPPPADRRPETIVLHATGSEHRIGPSRLWVDAARALAGDGVEVVRYDRRGTGDTGTVAPDEDSPFASATSRADLLDFAETLPSAPRDTMLIGMCSGSWNSAFVGAARGAREVVMINTAIWSLRKRRVPLRRAHFDAMESSTADRLFVVLRTVRNAGRDLIDALPYRAFAALGTLGVTNNPERLLRTLGNRSEHVTVLLSPEDSGVFRAGRGLQALRRARAGADRFTVVEFDNGDHTLIHRDLREETLHHLTRAVDRAFRRRPALSDGGAPPRVSSTEL
ncbi:alpha/beta fold hydrolase [Millisia brevis]|uniref:alpha/beta fold hydrolase n=1 Tax=Millisia brevis TaxID=264148 RepID=UPI0008342A27|nr:alpha/beta fold hydrolase [Millisia brevis]